MDKKTDNRLKCSFCGKKQDQVKKLIAGPGSYICNECVYLCNEILDDELFDAEPSSSSVPEVSRGARTDSNSRPEAPYKSFLQIKQRELYSASREPKRETDDAILNSEEHRRLLDEANVALDNLLKLYVDNKVRATAEPLYKALIYLNAGQLGGDNQALLPVVKELVEFYENRQEYESCVFLLRWLIDIYASNGLSKSERKLHMLRLASMYTKLADYHHTEVVLKQLQVIELDESKGDQKGSEPT
jgi:hypothetical protein